MALERLFVSWLLVRAEDDAAAVLSEQARRDRSGVTVAGAVDLQGALDHAAGVHILAAQDERVPMPGECKPKYKVGLAASALAAIQHLVCWMEVSRVLWSGIWQPDAIGLLLDILLKLSDLSG